MTLTARLRGAATFRVTNDDAGWADLVARITGVAPPTVVLEATGSYHRGLTAALAGAGMAPSVINPAWTHAFAKSEGRRAKTDRTDAQLLARYAQQKQPDPTPLPAETTRQLADLASYRDDPFWTERAATLTSVPDHSAVLTPRWRSA